MTLIDTGPLVAAFAVRDANHDRVNRILEHASFPLETTDACFVEAMYFLAGLGGAPLQAELLDMRLMGELVVGELSQGQLQRIRHLIVQYENVPMDYADATLVVTADARKYKSIFTFDSDFRIYRLEDGSALEIIGADL